MTLFLDEVLVGAIMPLYILAGLAVLFNNTVFTWIFKGGTLSKFQYWGTVVTNGTLNISGLLIALMVGYYLSRNRGYETPLVVALISLASLMVMMPNTSSVIPDGATKAIDVSGIVSFTNIGTGSMFAGIIVGLVASEIFIKLSSVKKIRVNLGESVPPAVGNSFNVLIPVIVVVAGFALVSAFDETVDLDKMRTLEVEWDNY